MRFVIAMFALLLIAGCKDTPPPIENSEPEKKALEIPPFDPVEWAAEDYRIDDQHSYIGFKIKYFGFSPVRGRFDTFNGYVFYDPDQISQTQMSLFIDVNSINTGNDRRDGDLITGSAWFNESEHPKITFYSTAVIPGEDGSFELVGDFSMNGITRELSIPFEPPTRISRDFAHNEQVDYSARLVIDRKEFGINGGDFWDTVLEEGVTQLSDEVEIELDIHTRRPDYIKRYDDLEAGNVRKIVLDAFANQGREVGLDSLQHYKAMKDSPLTSGALSTIGNTLLARNQLEDGLAVFEAARELYPDRVSYPMDTGVLYLLQNEKEKARKQFDSLLEADPYAIRAKAYLRLLDAKK
ncbi:MAG: YceI family protein [Bacteroidota bacterium]